MPNPLLYVHNSCWGGFAAFRCRLRPLWKTGISVYTRYEVVPPELFLLFSHETCPIHDFRSKTHVWGGFAPFRCRTRPIWKTGISVYTRHEFVPSEPFLMRTPRVHLLQQHLRRLQLLLHRRHIQLDQSLEPVQEN